MNKLEKEIIGIPVSGWETSHISTVKEDSHYFGYENITSLMKEAGVPPLDERVFTSFETLNYISDFRALEESKKESLKKFKEQTGRNFPRFHKIKISIETEELSEKESDEIWKNFFVKDLSENNKP